VEFFSDSFYYASSPLWTISNTDVVNLESFTIQHMLCRVISQLILSNHSMYSYLWNGIHKNLFVKSVSPNLFNLLGSSSSSIVDESSFGCMVIISMYLMLNFVIYSLTVDLCKSVYRSLFDIYHGAFTVVRRTLV
jgi:hypothetical protein